MTDKKLPTIKLKGKDYIQVKDRLLFFNEEYPAGMIRTQIKTVSDRMVTFKAVVIPDVSNPTRFFTGHSFGTVDEVKAFEKLETVAVGRALAFMGIGVLESIASADEIDRFHEKEAMPVNKSAAKYADEPAPIKFTEDALREMGMRGVLPVKEGVKNGRPWYLYQFQNDKGFVNKEQHLFVQSFLPKKDINDLPF